jgi:hypothetical protein
MGRNGGGLAQVEYIELARDTFIPGEAQRLYRKATAWDVRDQVQDGVNMNQARTILIQPDRRSSVTTQQGRHTREMLDHPKALGIRTVQCERAV